MKRKRRNNLGAFGAFSPALGLGMASAGASIIGGGLENVPGGQNNALLTVGSETSKYIAPTAAIGFMGFAMGGINKLNRKKRKR